MKSAVYHKVLEEYYIEHQGKKYAWTIPLAFPASAELAKTLKVGDKVALVGTSGEVAATLDITDVSPWPKLKYLKSVYLSDRIDHPVPTAVICRSSRSRSDSRPTTIPADEST